MANGWKQQRDINWIEWVIGLLTPMECGYHKLVETFHVVSECKTAIYFSWSAIHALAKPVQLFWPLVTFGVASSNSLTDSDFTTVIRDSTRPNETFIYTIRPWVTADFVALSADWISCGRYTYVQLSIWIITILINKVLLMVTDSTVPRSHTLIKKLIINFIYLRMMLSCALCEKDFKDY